MTKQQRVFKELGRNPDIMKPMGNYITLRMFKAEEATEGGIILTDQAREREKPMVAEVIAVGKGLRSNVSGGYLPPDVEPGDIVVLLRHATVEVRLAGEVFHVISELDILGRIKREDYEAVRTTVETIMAEEEAKKPKVVEEDSTTQITMREGSGLLVVSGKED